MNGLRSAHARVWFLSLVLVVGCAADAHPDLDASMPRPPRPDGSLPDASAPPPVAPLDGRMTPPESYDPTARYDWEAPPPDVVVNALEDGAPGAVTLARALLDVPVGGVIRIAPELAGAVLRTSEPLEIRRSLTLDASQAPGFTIDAAGRAGGIRVGRDLHTVLVGLTVRNVRTDRLGGGVFVDQADGAELGSVEVVGCTFEDNEGAAAGGLYVRRRIRAHVRDSVFRRNRAIDGTGDDLGKGGGAISARAEGSLLLERVVFTENDGPQAGAVYSIGQPVSIVHGVFVDNGGEASHGAILTDGGSIVLEGSLLRGNHGHGFGGAIQLYGYGSRGDTVLVRRSVLIDNWTTNRKGGAAYLIGAELRIDSSVFVRNRATQDAGAIYFPGQGTVWITNSIFGENVCTDRSGGGFRKDGGGPVTIERSMFVYNQAGESGGGFWMAPSLEGSVRDTVFSENGGGHLVAAAIANGGGNLFFPIREPAGTFADSTYADPRLGPLEETNGVWWYPPGEGSPTHGIGPSFPETQRR